MNDWQQFLMPYDQAVQELKVKLRAIRTQFRNEEQHSPVEFVTGRVKPIPSILNKAQKKNIPLNKLAEEMQDIAGLRIMCQFEADIYEVVTLLKKRNDLTIIQTRDYIQNKKESGYRSYHVILKYPVQLLDKEHVVLVEIQIRTLAMNFWATIEHSLNYKYQGSFPKELQQRLKRAAEAANWLDQEMSQIREEIQEAQKLFSHGKITDAKKLKDLSE